MTARMWRRDKLKTALLITSVTVSLLISYQTLGILLTTNAPHLTESPLPITTEGLEEFQSPEKLHSFEGEKLVHIDLKGAPPKTSYFEQFFPYIRELGATGVLIEYEDMFPYKDGLENITAKNSYTQGDLEAILKFAEDSNLMVIPAIEVLGHLEFVLKLKEFKDLREISEYPETLCPTNPKAFALVKKMISQVLGAHPTAKYIHIGCGEIQYLGNCDRCVGVMSKKKGSPIDLYVSYLRKVALYISETYPGVRPIVWADIISKLSASFLFRSQIYTVVDLMVFIRSPNVTEHLTDKMLDLYASVFKSIWIASAFKGGTGANQRVTDINFHLQNHISWMGVVEKWKELIYFKGILLTGRQRYDHFAELCELLPVATPSLRVNLIYLNNTESLKNNLSEKILQCEQPLFPYYDHYSSTPECSFPGLMIYRVVRKFEVLYKKIKTCFSVTDDGQFSIHNVMHKFISPVTVKYIFGKMGVEDNLSDLIIIEHELKASLLEVYDHDTAEEWVRTYIRPAQIKLEALMQLRDVLMEVDTWSRRPFGNGDQLLAESAKKICASDRKLDCILFFI